jgi:hypothetical protein
MYDQAWGEGAESPLAGPHRNESFDVVKNALIRQREGHYETEREQLSQDGVSFIYQYHPMRYA